MKKNGFTVIEVLATIIILSILSIITTVVVINVVDTAKDKADLDSAYAYIDAAKLYYYDAQLNSEKMQKLTNLENIYKEVVMKGNKPDIGELYSSSSGGFALALEMRNKCYYKEFDKELEVKNDYEKCSLGWVWPDNVAPTLEFSYDGTLGNNGWYTSKVWVHIKVNDNESGPYTIGWCSGSNCEIDVSMQDEKVIQKDVLLQNDGENIICAVGYDKKWNASEKICQTVKIDTQAPEFSGVEDLTVMKDTVVDLRNGVTVRDNLSRVVGDFTTTPDTVDTSTAKMIEITYAAKDQAGNEKQITRKVIIDALAPTVTFTPETGKINSNGWAKEDFYVNIGINDQSGTGIKDFYICTGNTSDTCDPKSGSHIVEGTTASRIINTEHNNNRICVQASDNNNKTSEIICSDAYKLDKTPPTAGTANFVGTKGKNNWYISDVIIHPVNGNDSLSGHASTTVNLDSVISDTNGTVIVATTTDLAGNSASRTYNVKVDKTPPNLTISSISQSSNTITVAVTATDNFGSVVNYSYQLDSNAPNNATSASYTFSGLTYGTTYKISVSASDQAGNTKIVTQNHFLQNQYYCKDGGTLLEEEKMCYKSVDYTTETVCVDLPCQKEQCYYVTVQEGETCMNISVPDGETCIKIPGMNDFCYPKFKTEKQCTPKFVQKKECAMMPTVCYCAEKYPEFRWSCDSGWEKFGIGQCRKQADIR